jgi:hypothetical protein
MCPRCHSRFTKTFYLDLFPDIACPADADTEAICLDCGLVFDWSEASIVCTDCHEVLDAVVAAFDQRCPECHLEVCPYCRTTLSDENPFPFWEPHEAPL